LDNVYGGWGDMGVYRNNSRGGQNLFGPPLELLGGGAKFEV